MPQSSKRSPHQSDPGFHVKHTGSRSSTVFNPEWPPRRFARGKYGVGVAKEQATGLLNAAVESDHAVIAEPLCGNVFDTSADRLELRAHETHESVDKRFVRARRIHVHHRLEQLQGFGQVALERRSEGLSSA